MFERIIEIIVLVISELSRNKSIKDINLESLTSKGYTNEEISTAFSWLNERLENSKSFLENYSAREETSVRMLNRDEKELFSPEAWGEIINLKTIGILSNQNIEAIIDWAAFLGLSRMTIGQLRDYLAFNIFKVSIADKNGNRLTLLGNDTVN